MRAIVTGGAGFIGSVLLGALNDAGVYDITVVDNIGSSIKWRNLVGKRFNRYFHKDEFFTLLANGDCSDHPDVIFHLGACSSTSETDADYLLGNNLRYSQMLCEYAQRCGARFIYASSAATYGLGEHGYSDDPSKLDSLRPINRYGFSKHLFDQWVSSQGLLSDLGGHVVGLKFFNVFGPNEYHKGTMVSMVLRAYQQIQQSGSVSLFRSNSPQFDDGEQRRDFIYVKDCVAVILALATTHRGVSGVYNLGTGVSRTWNDLANAVFATLSLTPHIEYIETPSQLLPGYQNFTEAEMGRLKAALGSVQLTPLEGAISDYVTQYLARDAAIF